MSLDIVLVVLELAEVRQQGDVSRLVEGSRCGVGEEDEEDEEGGHEDEDGCHILRITSHAHNFTSHHFIIALTSHLNHFVISSSLGFTYCIYLLQNGREWINQES